MREPAFLRQNKDKWREFERTLFESTNPKVDPDHLAELYVQLTDDLAYARTFYPKSQTVKYLNGLAARTHLAIYKNKKEKRNRFLVFWAQELPLIVASCHRQIFYAFLLFTAFFLIGVVSTIYVPDFPETVLGSGYIKMTIENIENGNPTGVYQQEGQYLMFLRIFLNNVQVSFWVFALGIVLSFGTIFGLPFWPFNYGGGLFYNGIMVGTFLTFFHQYGVLMEALPIIYIHGTLELSAIVIAGGAGLVMGNSIMFPGTYPRLQSLMQAAKNGMKIIIGLVPVFFMAAFLEGYVTRMADMHILGKLTIIIFSLAFIIGYYVLYPLYLSRKLRIQSQAI
ncbi:MAG: stage II sporulation protein M [Bacteroidota bacterium]